MSDPSTQTAAATFTIDLAPVDPELVGTGKFAFTKQWSGDVIGTGTGTMLSAGDPAASSAGYVVLETFTGSIGGRTGTLALQQFGTMHEGEVELHYQVVPGSGIDELTGLTGTVTLTVVEGVHTVRLEYTTAG